ncbi:hypothetical protein SAMN05421736_103314 [Evansella caseinilytica]|uniref:Uncharacterized protein n=1 Tax=Evansella caseinilytica TaxID=1503961 RepID=A0A1H3MRH9_9BACI|nr:hypothetical protein SAMN05421736_103314 [Evansella caseinilytica]
MCLSCGEVWSWLDLVLLSISLPGKAIRTPAGRGGQALCNDAGSFGTAFI